MHDAIVAESTSEWLKTHDFVADVGGSIS